MSTSAVSKAEPSSLYFNSFSHSLHTAENRMLALADMCNLFYDTELDAKSMDRLLSWCVSNIEWQQPSAHPVTGNRLRVTLDPKSNGRNRLLHFQQTWLGTDNQDKLLAGGLEIDVVLFQGGGLAPVPSVVGWMLNRPADDLLRPHVKKLDAAYFGFEKAA